MGFSPSEPRRAKLRQAAKIALGGVFVLASPVMYFYAVYDLMRNRVRYLELNSAEHSWLFKIFAGTIAMIFSLIQAVWVTPKALFNRGYHLIYDKIPSGSAGANREESVGGTKPTVATMPLTPGMGSSAPPNVNQPHTVVDVPKYAWERNPFEEPFDSTGVSKDGAAGPPQR